MKQEQKFQEILTNNFNGNWTIYKMAIRKLPKKQLLDFIEYSYLQGMKYSRIIKSLRIALQ